MNWIRLPLSRFLERVWISNQISPFCPQTWFRQEQLCTSRSVATDLDEHDDFFVENERDLGGTKTRICTVPKRVGNPCFTEWRIALPWQVNFYPTNKILRHLPWRELKISFCERGSIYKYVNSLALRNRYGEYVTNAEQTVSKGDNNKFLHEEKSWSWDAWWLTVTCVLNCGRLTTENPINKHNNSFGILVVTNTYVSVTLLWHANHTKPNWWIILKHNALNLD